MQYAKSNILDILKSIDEEAALAFENSDLKLSVVIVGGSALLLRDLTNRPTTHDIDILESSELLKDILSNYQMVNSRVKAYADQIPYNFEDRLVQIDIPTNVINFYTPSLEDLAVMKLYGWRPNDQEDLESKQFLAKIDWDLLERLVCAPEEAKASALSERRYKEMLSIYELYVKEHRDEADV